MLTVPLGGNWPEKSNPVRKKYWKENCEKHTPGEFGLATSLTEAITQCDNIPTWTVIESLLRINPFNRGLSINKKKKKKKK